MSVRLNLFVFVSERNQASNEEEIEATEKDVDKGRHPGVESDSETNGLHGQSPRSKRRDNNWSNRTRTGQPSRKPCTDTTIRSGYPERAFTESEQHCGPFPENEVQRPNQEEPGKKNGAHRTKLQALVYDIIPSTTAVFSYAIGPRKLSANEYFLLVLKQ